MTGMLIKPANVRLAVTHITRNAAPRAKSTALVNKPDTESGRQEMQDQ